MQLFDTHAHLYDKKLWERLDEVVRSAHQSSVTRMIAVGCDAETSRQCIQIAEEQSAHGVFASVGIQPNYCHEVKDSEWTTIVELAEHPRVVALGETGLDLYWKDCPFPIQKDYFARHWELSRVTGLPVIIHMRDCESEIVADMQKHAQGRGLNGVMHSFTGSAKTAAACLDLGLYISFAGMITYKKAQDIRDVARTIPLDRILIETDSPYLSPEPKRSVRPNEPALVLHTAACLAEVLGMRLNEIAEVTSANALRLFQRCNTTKVD